MQEGLRKGMLGLAVSVAGKLGLWAALEKNWLYPGTVVLPLRPLCERTSDSCLPPKAQAMPVTASTWPTQLVPAAAELAGYKLARQPRVAVPIVDGRPCWLCRVRVSGQAYGGLWKL